ncbi:transcriptional repressor LexA [Halobacteriovorax sp. HLS]|uniref:transcriptional repressor LexA n=1 Tax=Halobacteriovorax sp. HLS TaxID=2234000 RepID=UPI000FDB59CD|nr:transcriptional repressor LexA [Halobacteriovorax sp. HLS]
MGITKKQKEVLDFITNYWKEHEVAPTQKEIKEAFQLKSYGSVQRYLKYLKDSGHIENDWNARRGLKPVDENEKALQTEAGIEIPLLGDVAAGIPIEAIENPDNTIQVPSHMIHGNHKFYALNVKGDSMIEDGIFERDIIICKHQTTANRGQTIIALVDGEATVKRYQPRDGKIELIPANSSMSPIVVDPRLSQFSIAGVLVGLMRSYE